MRTPKRIMNAARGEKCTLNIVGVCNYGPDTVVACHLPSGDGGSSRLSGPLSIAFGCSSCHDFIDGRNIARFDISDNDLEFYLRRGQTRTLNRLIEMELVKI